MTTIAFDTFKFIDRLEKAGLSRDQAVAISEAQRDTFADALDNQLATKADTNEVKRDIALLRKDFDLLRSEISTIELRLSIKLGTMLAVMAGVMIAILKL